MNGRTRTTQLQAKKNNSGHVMKIVCCSTEVLHLWILSWAQALSANSNLSKWVWKIVVLNSWELSGPSIFQSTNYLIIMPHPPHLLRASTLTKPSYFSNQTKSWICHTIFRLPFFSVSRARAWDNNPAANPSTLRALGRSLDRCEHFPAIRSLILQHQDLSPRGTTSWLPLLDYQLLVTVDTALLWFSRL